MQVGYFFSKTYFLAPSLKLYFDYIVLNRLFDFVLFWYELCIVYNKFVMSWPIRRRDMTVSMDVHQRNLLRYLASVIITLRIWYTLKISAECHVAQKKILNEYVLIHAIKDLIHTFWINFGKKRIYIFRGNIDQYLFLCFCVVFQWEMKYIYKLYCWEHTFSYILAYIIGSVKTSIYWHISCIYKTGLDSAL